MPAKVSRSYNILGPITKIIRHGYMCIFPIPRTATYGKETPQSMGLLKVYDVPERQAAKARRTVNIYLNTPRNSEEEATIFRKMCECLTTHTHATCQVYAGRYHQECMVTQKIKRSGQQLSTSILDYHWWVTEYYSYV